MSKALAITCSDLHITLRPPSFRSKEKSWLDAMERQFNELKALQKVHDCIIVCAGDIFDRWNVNVHGLTSAINTSPEIINWTIKNLPFMYCVYGNHDLPNHQPEDIAKSAYWTLVEADAIRDISNESFLRIGDGLILWPFAYGKEITPLENPSQKYINLAVVHKYIWKDHTNSYVGADESAKAPSYLRCLRGYDAAAFGDNHQGFITHVGSCHVMNCGTFFRRKSDERGYRPQVGLLFDDGTFVPHYLDTSLDVYLDDLVREKKEAETEVEAKAFLTELRELGSDSLDFRDALNRKMEKIGTGDAIRRCVEEAVR